MIYARPGAPTGVFIEPHTPGSVLTSRGENVPPIFTLTPSRVESRMALNVPLVQTGDKAIFLALPAKYELFTFRAYDATSALDNGIVRLRTGPNGTGTIISAITLAGMAPGQTSKLGSQPVVPMLTQPQLYVHVTGTATTDFLTVLLHVLNLDPGELIPSERHAEPNLWQARLLDAEPEPETVPDGPHTRPKKTAR